MEYQDKYTRIQITSIINDGFYIYLYPQKSNSQSIYLCVTLSDNFIRIEDLVGNGEHSGFQNKGYGTLLVNLAIQIIRLIYNDRPNILVTGRVSNMDDEDLVRSSQRRNHFWSSFGFKLKDQKAYNTRMEARLSDLVLKDRGMLSDSLSSMLSLSKFYRYFNRPLISIDVDDRERHHSGRKKRIKDIG